jgi:hypothetical protein
MIYNKEFYALKIYSSLDLINQNRIEIFRRKKRNPLFIPVSVSHNLTILSYEAERNSVPALLKFTSRTA